MCNGRPPAIDMYPEVYDETDTSSPAAGSAIISVEHMIEQFTGSGCSVWKRGLLMECEKELEELKRDLPYFDKHEWRIVRVEKRLIAPND